MLKRFLKDCIQKSIMKLFMLYLVINVDSCNSLRKKTLGKSKSNLAFQIKLKCREDSLGEEGKRSYCTTTFIIN